MVEFFLISERIKLQAYHRQQAMNFFWRTVAKQEIDFVEEKNDHGPVEFPVVCACGCGVNLY
ncbi:MAG: hypothetical protein DA446_08145 [Bacteroidetes bacterium]|nr:hypothetical protein [Bacteroidota bacterium]PTM19485.1 MAG: hypothetical protein DA446_08145 [Bacteroidota bacterium]